MTDFIFYQENNSDLITQVDGTDLDIPVDRSALCDKDSTFFIAADLDTNTDWLLRKISNSSTSVTFKRTNGSTYTSEGEIVTLVGGRPPHPPHPGS